MTPGQKVTLHTSKESTEDAVVSVHVGTDGLRWVVLRHSGVWLEGYVGWVKPMRAGVARMEEG